MIRLLIVDDSLFIRTIVNDMLADDPDIEVVGTAVDGLDAITKIQDLRPDLMTLDIEMPNLNGIELLATRREIVHFPRTLMLSSLTSEGAQLTKKSMDLGADDFMLKPKGIKNLRENGTVLQQKIKNICNISHVTSKRKPTGAVADRIIAIGSSAGGPPMLDVVLSKLPADIKAAVVVTQHMPKGGFTTALAARLNKISPLEVKESEDGDVLKQGQVIISQAGYHTVIEPHSGGGKRGGKIVHTTTPPLHNVKPAVDKTFESAAAVYGKHVVACILSGMGNDGGAGMAAIKGAGGDTLLCRKEDCLVYGMARSALQHNSVDDRDVLPLKDIAQRLATVSNSQV
jgi:two-component system chemotaxis response regulator CheB